LIYTPEPGYHGPDSFSYTVTDDEMAGGGALTNAAETVSITDAHWAAVAEPLGLGFGNDHERYNGSGTYLIGTVGGSINESGSWREDENYMVTGALLPDQTWDLLGTAHASGRGSGSNASSSYYFCAGGGTYMLRPGLSETASR